MAASSSIFALVFQQKSMVRDIAVASLLINLFVLAIPLFTMNVYDRVLPTFDTATLFVLALGTIGLLFFDFLLRMTRSRILFFLSSSVEARQEENIHHYILNQPVSEEALIGNRLNILTQYRQFQGVLSAKMLPFLFDFPFTFMFVTIIYVISPILALAPLVCMVLMMVCGYLCARLSVAKIEKRAEFSAEKMAKLLVALKGLTVIQSYAATQDVITSISDKDQEERYIASAISFYQSLAGNFAIFCGFLLSVFVLVIGVFQVNEGVLTIGGLIAISILSGRAIAPLIGGVTIFSDWFLYKKTQDLLTGMDDLLEHDNSLSDKDDFKGRLSAHQLRFAYQEGKKNNIEIDSIVFEAGQHYGLIGASGAGKTTLMQILCGNLHPQSGDIKWGNYDIDAISMAQRHRDIAMISQNDPILPGTIAENVFCGQNALRRDDQSFVDSVMYVSGLDRVMQASGFGWDTAIDDMGRGLSEGQKQSIILARGLMKNAKIVVFDEPLMAIDRVLEERLKQALPGLLAGKTFILITHRSSMMSLVENLYVMDQGRITAKGRREDILKGVTE